MTGITAVKALPVKVKNLFPNFIRSLLNSYSQIFFSDNRIFALILMLVSFFDLVAGLSGLLCVVFSNILAYIVGFNRANIIAGLYGFNSLLIGLGMGSYYELNTEFFLILGFASILALFLSILFEGIIGKYGLPYLSLPFLLGIWMLILATRQFTNLQISERGVYMLNDMYALGGIAAVKTYLWMQDINLHESVVIYFRSLGAIFFQYHMLAGIFIAVGLLIYSRIAFMLSLIGFFAAYVFYTVIGANISELNYSYIGFNFILTSIAVGGFFIISSRYSILWVLLLTPLISIVITSSGAIMSLYQLPVYSLPFNFIVLLFLYILKFRERFYSKPEQVIIQHFSPEKNLYIQHNNRERFRNSYYFPFSLPFWGEWRVTQAHDGEITHKKEWKHAWDFEIFDEKGQPHKGSGLLREDYYCYNKPIVASFDGKVEEILDDIDDNPIGEINTEENWGNTIVIKHAEGLYSKISHLKKGSFKVKKDDTVKKGDILARCGNSGRSPQPHVHFQIQTTPFIGSKTLDYPLGHYILNNKGKYILKSFEKPEKNEEISPIEKDHHLFKALHLIPGQHLEFVVHIPGQKNEKKYKWEVLADFYNNTYIWCSKTKSKLYFKSDDDMVYFTAFSGKKRSLLFYFYLAFYKMLFGYYKNMELKDTFPINTLQTGPLIFIQDFFAPFFIFLKTTYSQKQEAKTGDFSESNFRICSKVDVKIFNLNINSYDFEIFIKNDKIEKFSIRHNKTFTEAIMLQED